jgi:transketolase
MPSFELFDAQPEEYRDEVLPPSVAARLGVEAASPLGWERWVGLQGDVLGLRRFGASAPYTDVYKHLNFTPEYIAERARALVRGPERDGSPRASLTADRASFQKASGAS